jgi:lysophospholipase L1-like esterase
MIRIIFIVFTLLFVSKGVAQTYSDHYYQRKAIFEDEPDTKREIIFLGNSITEGCDWKSLFPEKNVINRGISGDVTMGILNRLDEVTSSKPAKIFLLIGTNDLARGKGVEHVVKYYRLIIEKILKDSKRTKLYIQSVLPYNPNIGDRFKGHKSKQKEVIIVNEILRDLAKEYKLTYIDIYISFSNEKGELKAIYTDDGLHLNQLGNEHWKESISKYVNKK